MYHRLSTLEYGGAPFKRLPYDHITECHDKLAEDLLAGNVA
jgi:hypothetical protein